ncbi:hypothetical protein NC652_019560 [Populus alba x Populus x berolinensis]|nr:hypothetical protein NC652_019560 [Populus alba x Populus x berolinensis]
MQSTSSRSTGNGEQRKRKRKLVLDDDGNSDGEGGGESVEGSVVDPCQQAPPGVPAPPLTMPQSSLFSESYENVCAQPLSIQFGSMDERAFESLVDEIILHDYALKAVVNNLEILIFSSRELPRNSQEEEAETESFAVTNSFAPITFLNFTSSSSSLSYLIPLKLNYRRLVKGKQSSNGLLAIHCFSEMGQPQLSSVAPFGVTMDEQS